MKNLFILMLSVSLLSACGGGKSGTNLAQEVCDCSKKANAMDAADPKRATSQSECLVKQGEAWAKVKDKKEKADEFNKLLSACASEQIKSSFGK